MADFVNRVSLFNALTMVAPGLTNGRETCLQSGCYVFYEGWVFTFNEEVSCRAPLEGFNVYGAIPAQGVLELLDKVPDDNFVVVEDESSVQLRAETYRRITWVKQNEIQLETHLVEMPDEWHDIPPGMVEGCVIAAGCTKKDANKFLAQCVHIGPGYVEACDNVQVSRFMVDGLDADVLVRGATIKRINDMHFTHWALTENWMHFTNSTGAIFSCRIHRRDYIDLNGLLDAEVGELLTLPGGLPEIIARATVAASLAIGDTFITVELKAGRLRVTGQGLPVKYEEVVQTSYTGPDMSFVAAPAMLDELAKAHSNVYLATGRLCVKSTCMTYITSVKDTTAATDDIEATEATEEAAYYDENEEQE